MGYQQIGALPGEIGTPPKRQAHSRLVGLEDDNHPQYLTEFRHEGFHSAQRFEKTGNQSINGSTNTAITFGLIVFVSDPNDDFSFQTDTLTINNPGIYEIGAGVDWGTSSGGTRLIYLEVNGTTRIVSQRYPSSTASSEMSLSTIYEFAEGDTIKLFVRQDTGGALAVDGVPSTNLWIRRL